MADEKKIIIDEDWKSQVQAEKEAARQAAAGSAGEATSASAPAGEPAPAAQAAGDRHEMPPASFEMLVTTLATEVLVALGQIPHPGTGKAELHVEQARYLIDTLDMLRQKTKGNLDPNETQLLESVVHQLRLVFVEITSRPKPA
jgi:hypothetical protein